MDIVDKLNNEFLKQDFSPDWREQHLDALDKYKKVAFHYACLENGISVLSDMQFNSSYIYCGRFAKDLGVTDIEGEINSIWEEKILALIHPDDLYDKYLQELRFFHFIKRQSPETRSDYYLVHWLRMKDAEGNYRTVLHRLFYILSPFDHTMWLALCLYNPLSIESLYKGIVVRSTTGEIIRLGKDDAKILSKREKQVLQLIEKGMMSKAIAESLSISVHTVSRHRQEILSKLQVKNSIEACRVAKDLGII